MRGIGDRVRLKFSNPWPHSSMPPASTSSAEAPSTDAEVDQGDVLTSAGESSPSADRLAESEGSSEGQDRDSPAGAGGGVRTVEMRGRLTVVAGSERTGKRGGDPQAGDKPLDD